MSEHSRQRPDASPHPAQVPITGSQPARPRPGQARYTIYTSAGRTGIRAPDSVLNRLRSFTARASATPAARAAFSVHAARRPVTAVQLSVGALFAAVVATLTVRVATLPATMVTDDWAYTVWGDTFWNGHLRLPATATYGKPLGYLIGLAAAPFDADRAIPLLSAVALAAAVAAVFRAGLKSGGPAGAAAAVTAFVLAAGFAQNFHWALIDGIVGALVALAAASNGRMRVGLLVIAGLARIEAWPVAALAAILATRGRRLPVRLAAGAAGGLAAPLIWAGADILVWGQPFEFIGQLHGHFPTSAWGGGSRVAEIALGQTVALPALGSPQATSGLGYLGPLQAVSALWQTTSSEAGALAAILGAAGLLMLLVRNRFAGDLFAPLAAATWAVALLVEYQHGMQAQPRYTTPLAVLLAVGIAPVVRRVPWRGPVALGGAAALAAGVTIAATVAMRPDPPQPNTWQATLIAESMPTLRAALRCGPMGVFSSMPGPSPITPIIAVTGDTPLTQLPTLHRTRNARELNSTLVPGDVEMTPPRGRRLQLPIGVLVLSPACRLQPQTILSGTTATS